MGPVTDIDVDDEADIGRVRRAVRQALPDAGDDLSYAAQLVASELATNALLHGGGQAKVSITTGSGSVRIAVRDKSPHAPLLSVASNDTMTGRGLSLVAQLVSRWGVDPVDQGKVVWAELSEEMAAGPPSGVAPTMGPPAAQELEEPLVDIVIGEVPTDLLVAAKRHVDNVVRELVLAAGGERSGTTRPVSRPLADLLEQVVERFSVARLAIKRLATEAAREGEPRTMLALSLPVSAADSAVAYLDALDEVDAYSRANRLLTLETPPQHRVFRRWYVGEIVRQLRAAERGERIASPTTLEQRLLEEVDASDAARRAAERAARLYTVAVALAAAVTPEQVSAAVLSEGCAALGAIGGGLLVAGDRDRLALTGAVGYDESVLAKLKDEPPDAELPAAYALRTGEAVWLESIEVRDERFPDLVGFEPDTVAMCAVPAKVESRVVGALRFSFGERRLFGEDEQRFVLALAAETAEALQRAELLRSEQEARQQVLENTLRLRRLTDLAIAVNQAGDVAELVDLAAGRAKEIVGADDVAVLLGDEAVDGAGAGSGPGGDTLHVPLVSPTGELLALVVLARRGATFGDDDRDGAIQLAEIVSSALFRAMLHDERRRIAVVLQQSLLPPTLPEIPWLEVATQYRPGSELVGGDFYDVFPLGDTAWGIVIGDVRGKGPDAAATTALARHSTRTAALLAGRPGRVLQVVNEALAGGSDPELFCTAAYLRVLDTGGRLSVELASGGHPPLLHARSSDGSITRVAATGPLLGAFPGVEIGDEAIVLEPGDLLVAYTDGITEARSGADQFGEARLCELLSGHLDQSADAVARAVIDAATEFSGPHAGDLDDAAVVVLRATAR